MTRPRLVHVITGLNTGGAETTLLELARHAGQTSFDHTVVCLTDPGPTWKLLNELGVQTINLGMPRGIPDPRAIWRLRRLLRRHRADVVQTWLYHGDLIGGLAAKLAGVPVTWGVRHSNLARGVNQRSTRLVARACGLLARWVPSAIICCAESALRPHQALGYPAERMLVIPNGFDLAAFRPNREARRSVRAELGIPLDAPLVGMLARFHPQKDLPMFARMAGLLTAREPAVHVLLAGTDLTWDNAELASWLDAAGVPRDRMHPLGRRSDTPRVQAALDVACLTSRAGEAFPRVLGEAMACGVPCVATNIGDSAMIVDVTGLIVPPGDAELFAEAVTTLLTEDPVARAERSRECRARVTEHFDIDVVVGRFDAVWQRLFRGENPCA